MDIVDATVEDAAEILDLQKLAYQSEAEIHKDHDIPPLKQTLAEMEEDFTRQHVLKAIYNGRIVGSVRAHADGGTCFIGHLIVHPHFQNQGIGTALMMRIERYFSTVERYELFTGHKSERNLYLYAKLGYVEFRRQQVSANLTFVFLEKGLHTSKK